MGVSKAFGNVSSSGMRQMAFAAESYPIVEALSEWAKDVHSAMPSTHAAPIPSVQRI